jgi:glycosyltransferase involved in cell wall biosynthesis
MTAANALTVTVIVPLYNGARFLEHALSSIAAQSTPPLEVIIVDDGSVDASAEIAEAFGQAHPELGLRVVCQQNAGQSAARNRAAREAKGELLAFLDQDDHWYPDHLRRLVAAFTRPDIGLAFSDFDEVDEFGNVVVRGFMRTHRVPHPRTSIIDWLAHDTMILPSASVVRTSAYRGLGGFNEELIGYEDDELWIRMFRAGWRSRYVERSLGSYRVHAGSSSARESFRRSRVVFFRLVSAMLPDQVELRRYYMTDVLLPRLLTSTLAEYRGAIRAARYDDAVTIARTVAELVTASGAHAVSRGRLRLLTHPRLVRWGAKVARTLPGAVRRQLNPTRLSQP